MSEHRITDEGALSMRVEAMAKDVHYMARDVHYVLGWIAVACASVAFAAMFIAATDAARGLWVSVAIDVGASVAFWLACYQASKRRRKYRVGQGNEGGKA